MKLGRKSYRYLTKENQKSDNKSNAALSWHKLYSTLFMHLKEAILAIKQKELVIVTGCRQPVHAPPVVFANRRLKGIYFFI